MEAPLQVTPCGSPPAENIFISPEYLMAQLHRARRHKIGASLTGQTAHERQVNGAVYP